MAHKFSHKSRCHRFSSRLVEIFALLLQESIMVSIGDLSRLITSTSVTPVKVMSPFCHPNAFQSPCGASSMTCLTNTICCVAVNIFKSISTTSNLCLRPPAHVTLQTLSQLTAWLWRRQSPVLTHSFRETSNSQYCVFTIMGCLDVPDGSLWKSPYHEGRKVSILNTVRVHALSFFFSFNWLSP